MQTKRKLSLSAFLSTFLIVLLFSVCINSVYAYFTATTERDFSLNFATLEIDLQDSSNVSYTEASLTQKINGAMPGDTIDFSDIYVKNMGTANSYTLMNAEVEIAQSGQPTLTFNNWYNLSGGKVKVSNFAENVVGATYLASQSSSNFDLSWTIPGDIVTDEYQGATITINLTAHAVQSCLPDAAEYESEPLYASYFIVKDAHEGQPLNLLNLEDRVVRDFGTQRDNTVSRDIIENSYYIGVTATNYYNTSMVSEYSINDGVIKLVNSSRAYGIGMSVKVSPNSSYTLSLTHNSNIFIGVIEYDTAGNYLSNPKTKQSSSPITFSTSATASWIVIVLHTTDSNVMASFSNIQLVEGSTAPAYKPYVNLNTEPLKKS